MEPSILVDDPTLSMVAVFLSCVRRSRSIAPRACQRPLNSSIEAMSWRISDVILTVTSIMNH
ncbi:hypothetical protein [Rubritalea tangerina]|uniref:hypothetical protein n=1 Tax=Rubritalea tangerina TaxID=430798 RepID=UPI00360A7CF8